MCVYVSWDIICSWISINSPLLFAKVPLKIVKVAGHAVIVDNVHKHQIALAEVSTNKWWVQLDVLIVDLRTDSCLVLSCLVLCTVLTTSYLSYCPRQNALLSLYILCLISWIELGGKHYFSLLHITHYSSSDVGFTIVVVLSTGQSGVDLMMYWTEQ